MKKFTLQEEKELIIFIKDWLKSHGYSQKDLAQQLNINSSRTSEIMNKMQALYKRGGIINVAKNLIKIEQYWINNKKNIIDKKVSLNEYEKRSYNQLDINYKLDLDKLMDQMEKDHKIN